MCNLIGSRSIAIIVFPMVNHWPIWIEYAVPLFPNGVVRLYATFQRHNMVRYAAGEARGYINGIVSCLNAENSIILLAVKRSFRGTLRLISTIRVASSSRNFPMNEFLSLYRKLSASGYAPA